MVPQNEEHTEYYFTVNRSDGLGDITFEQCPFVEMSSALRYMSLEKEHLVTAYMCVKTETYTELKLSLIPK